MTYYRVVKNLTEDPVDDYSFEYREQYYIVDIASNEKLYGPYRDYGYAKKQARRKYKKVVRNMERALMSSQ